MTLAALIASTTSGQAGAALSEKNRMDRPMRASTGGVNRAFGWLLRFFVGGDAVVGAAAIARAVAGRGLQVDGAVAPDF